MNKSILVLSCFLLSVSVTAETVYKKTNPDGSIEFSDTSSKDSEEVKIRKPIIIPAPRLPVLSSPNKKAKVNYEVTIIEPVKDATIIGNVEVEVKVLVSVFPELFIRHKFRYQLGDQIMETHNNSAHFKNVNRGTHIIHVSVIDQKGELVSSGAKSTFHMKRFFKKPKTVKPKTP